MVNLKDWCKNRFEVVSQLRINTRSSHHRYDVILLINGLPLVQIELKGLAVSPRRAMQQIVEYKHDPGNGYTNSLLCFMQLFIVSNRSETWYFANNSGEHFRFDADERFLPVYRFAEQNNKKINHLDEFADAFLAKCTLAEMLSRYMVLIQSERKLMMMRPYQIYAVQAIVDCIHQNRGNGYIWHTTGSGKTLTSFKASTLLKDNPDIEKCLFVVDRKDLDRQTRRPHPQMPRIYLYREPVDFRKSYRGLAAIVEQELGHNPFEGALYAFTNRRRDKIKLLYWEDNGFVLYYKSLAEEKFYWPKGKDEVLTLSGQQINWLLDGYDLGAMKGHRKLQYEATF